MKYENQLLNFSYIFTFNIVYEMHFLLYRKNLNGDYLKFFFQKLANCIQITNFYKSEGVWCRVVVFKILCFESMMKKA